MKKENQSILKLTMTAMLASIEFILTRYLKIMIGPAIRISFGFLPMAAVAILYGPIWAGITFGISDIIGANLLPIGPYYPGFTLSAVLTGVIFGLVLHKREITWLNVSIACFIVIFAINLGLDTFWLSQLMNKGVLALIPMRIVKCLIMLPIEIVLIKLMWDKVLSKITYVKELRQK